MARKPEGTIEDRIVEELETLKPSRWLKIQQVSKAGDSDQIGCYAGRFFTVEIKFDASSPIDPLQIYKLKKFRQAGAVSLLLHKDNYIEAIERIRQCKKCANCGQLYYLPRQFAGFCI